jgi:8-oxo-dGTP pyrophosphatase MutT (NUDIX family)
VDPTERAPSTSALRPGSTEAPLWDPSAIPAATVIVLRDSPQGINVLMLKRNRDLAFAGGMWVFPGGRIDPEDFESAGLQGAGIDTAQVTEAQITEQDLERSAAVAAVREAREEANLFLQVADLQRWSHWTPPPETPKRFSTAFFIAPWRENSGEVTVDDGEIREHRWELPARVLELRDAGEVGLTPPTFITLSQLLRFTTVSAVFAAAETRPFEHFATRIAVDGSEIVAMYHGDSGYESGDPNLGGAKHRLRMATTWQYERDAQADE